MHTERLTLVALTPELALAAMEDRAKLERMLEAHVPEAWQGADFATMLPRIARGVEQTSPGADAHDHPHGGEDHNRGDRIPWSARPVGDGRGGSPATAGEGSPTRRRGP